MEDDDARTTWGLRALRVWVDGVVGELPGAPGVFSTDRVPWSPLVWPHHVRRLRRDARSRGHDVSALVPALHQDLLRAAAVDAAPSSTWRFGFSFAHRLRRVVVELSGSPEAFVDGAPGLRLCTRPDPRMRPVAKSTDRAGLRSLDDAAAREGYGGTVLVADDSVLEGTYFHVGLLIDGRWCFPPTGPACTYGTTRARLLPKLCASGIPFQVRRVGSAETLTSAIAMSALRGVVPVAVWNRSALAEEPARALSAAFQPVLARR